MTNKPDLTRDACKFVISKQVIEPHAHKLKIHRDVGLFVLSNVTNAVVRCQNGTHEVAAQPTNCSLSFLRLGCGCVLTAEGLKLQGDLAFCSENQTSTSEVLHAVNLALLQNFYDLNNKSVDAEFLENTEQTTKAADLYIPVMLRTLY
jgi:hypothetical protein